MKRLLLTPYHLLAYYCSFLLFGLLGLALNLGCLVAGAMHPTARTERLTQHLIHRLFAFWVRWLAALQLVHVRFVGFTRPPSAGGLVLVANHPGLMDITYLLARLPEAVCIFKPAIRRNPVLGAAARCAGYLAGDGGHDLIRTAAAHVAAGRTLVIFPEGTRTRQGPLNPLRPGFALIAHRARAPIQLVRITSDSDLLVKGRAWWKLPRLPAHVAVTLGPRLLPTADAETNAIVARVEAWFRHEPDLRPASRPSANSLPSERWQSTS